MKFANCLDAGGGNRLGVLSADAASIHFLADMGYAFQDMVELIRAWSPDLRRELDDKLAKSSGGVAVAEVALDAPIPHPRHDLLCVGLNYIAHGMESAKYKGIEYRKPKVPVYFSKRVDRAVAPGGIIRAHADITSKLDYEVELAVVIGSRCDHVRPEEVFGRIFGYTIVNDVSARELQSDHVQYAFGKSLDGFTPMGPWIASRDEFRDPPHLRVRTRVNGDIRQDSNTNDFIFDIPYLVAQLSTGIVLEPGDILITGTPSGVGMGFQPPRFLKPGDVVECEVEGIGVLSNTVG